MLSLPKGSYCGTSVDRQEFKSPLAQIFVREAKFAMMFHLRVIYVRLFLLIPLNAEQISFLL